MQDGGTHLEDSPCPMSAERWAPTILCNYVKKVLSLSLAVGSKSPHFFWLVSSEIATPANPDRGDRCHGPAGVCVGSRWAEATEKLEHCKSSAKVHCLFAIYRGLGKKSRVGQFPTALWSSPCVLFPSLLLLDCFGQHVPSHRHWPKEKATRVDHSSDKCIAKQIADRIYWAFGSSSASPQVPIPSMLCHPPPSTPAAHFN
jgi:hypothetical protein